MKELHKNLIQSFIEHEKRRGLAATRELSSYLKPLYRYMEENSLDVKEMGLKQAQDYQTYLTTLEKEDGTIYYASFSIANLITTACRFFYYLKETGVVYRNPFTRIKRIRTARKLPKHIPNEQKMAFFLEYLRKFWCHEKVRDQRIYYKIHVMAELQYATGMRIAEVMDLEEADIDLDGKLVKVKKGKGDKERWAYLNEYAAKVLRLYLAEMREVIIVKKGSTKVFGVGEATGMVQTMNKFLKLSAEACGIPGFTSHSFRHSLGFHLLRRGCDMRYIQIILGHEDMNTTTLYTKVEKGDLKNELDAHHPRQIGGEHERIA